MSCNKNKMVTMISSSLIRNANSPKQRSISKIYSLFINSTPSYYRFQVAHRSALRSGYNQEPMILLGKCAMQR